MTDNAVLVWSTAAVMVCTLVGLVARTVSRGVRWTIRLLRGVDSFLDDWRGTEARPGVPARPGVLARLGALELRVDEIAGRLGDVERELRLNGGTSLRDAVHRIEQRLG